MHSSGSDPWGRLTGTPRRDSRPLFGRRRRVLFAIGAARHNDAGTRITGVIGDRDGYSSTAWPGHRITGARLRCKRILPPRINVTTSPWPLPGQVMTLGVLSIYHVVVSG